MGINKNLKFSKKMRFDNKKLNPSNNETYPETNETNQS